MTTCHCGATWTGHRIEHCTACHETFTGTGPGDMHRTGRHDTTTGPERRRCLTRDEMREKGMTQNLRGQWTAGGVSPFATRPILATTQRSRNDEHPSPRVVGHSEGGEPL